MIYREITMLKLNSEVSFFSVEIDVEISMLESFGWDFDEYYSNTASALGIEMEEAISYCKGKYFARIRVEGEEKYSSYTWVDRYTNHDTEYAETGDNESTINDIITLLNNGYLLRSDECKNQNGEFIPFAI